MSAPEPGPLVSGEWLAAHLGDPGSAHSPRLARTARCTRRTTCPGAVFSDLHVDLAKAGVQPETGPANREYLVPTREDMAASLRSWGVAPGDRSSSTTTPARTVTPSAATGCCGSTGSRGSGSTFSMAGSAIWLEGGPSDDGRAGAPAPVDTPSRSASGTTHSSPRPNRSASWSARGQPAGWPDAAPRRQAIDEFLGSDVRAARGGRIPGARHRLFSEFGPGRPAPAGGGGTRHPQGHRRRARRTAGDLLPGRRPCGDGLVRAPRTRRPDRGPQLCPVVGGVGEQAGPAGRAVAGVVPSARRSAVKAASHGGRPVGPRLRRRPPQA